MFVLQSPTRHRISPCMDFALEVCLAVANPHQRRRRREIRHRISPCMDFAYWTVATYFPISNYVHVVEALLKRTGNVFPIPIARHVSTNKMRTTVQTASKYVLQSPYHVKDEAESDIASLGARTKHVHHTNRAARFIRRCNEVCKFTFDAESPSFSWWWLPLVNTLQGVAGPPVTSLATAPRMRPEPQSFCESIPIPAGLSGQRNSSPPTASSR